MIGFALVAIIGILPTGMNFQKENRQETIIAQDATVFMNAFRNGERGLDDLTNYVTGITNYRSTLRPNGSVAGTAQIGYNYFTSTINGSPEPNPFRLTNGFRIIGLLATPKIVINSQGIFSNHVVAFVRSLSGPASEKFPQTNSSVEDLALSYRMIADVTPYGTNFFDPLWTNYSAQAVGSDTNLAFLRSNYMHQVWQFQTNLHDIRLIFRWPMLPNGNVSDISPRQVFRTTVAGSMLITNDNGYPPGVSNLYFFQPRIYAKAP
jgi:hypothetical protein